MPNVGKPSKACKHCRDRKVKCDLKRPSCSQCLRVGLDCHGYRDPLSMMFKNESNVVMDKAQKRYEELSKRRAERKRPGSQQQPVREIGPVSSPSYASASASSESSISPHSIYTDTAVSQLAAPNKPMLISIENQALGFFAANNLMQPLTVRRGNFQWLFQMLNGPSVDASLRDSAHAMSIAALGTANKSSALMNKAQEHYTRALKLTNEALNDPVKLYDDSTLVSVILLGVYENFVFNRDSMRAWMQHTKGASTLFAVRGETQFRSEIAREIFMQFYRGTVTSSVELGTPIPDSIIRLYKYMTSVKDYTIHGVERQVEVLEKAIKIMESNTSDPVATVADVLKLDNELDVVNFRLQTLWRYETVYLDKPVERVFGNFYHIYTIPWVINMWNILRTLRIRLFKFVRAEVTKGRQCDPPLFSEKEAFDHFITCNEVISTMTLDLCATTPQLTGQIAFPHQVKQNINLLSGGMKSANLKNKMYKIHPQGTFLEPYRSTGLDRMIGPLYEIGRSDFGPKLTQWAVDQLLFIARRIGTRQAIYMAEELQEKLKDESNFKVWDDPCPTSAQLAHLARV